MSVTRHFLFLVAFALVFTGAVPVGAPFGDVSVAHAQEQRERKKGLLELLFQRNRKNQRAEPQRKAAPKPRVVQPRKVAPKRKAKPAPKRSTTVARPRKAAPAAPIVEKSENARRVLVLGDFIADGMAQGLETAFAEAENVVIVNRTNGSSGFVRDDFYDWPAEVPAILEEIKPDIILVQLGANDRQAMRVDGTREKVRSEAWTGEYVNRVEAFVDEIRKVNRPIVWVGSPPFRFKSMSADMLAFNEIFRTRVEAKDGSFVDIWDGFVNENGNYTQTGDDIKGQKVRLRAGDGINFTRAGRRKIAFYAERQLKVLLGDATAPVLSSLSNENLPMMMLPPLQTEAELVRTNPISFADTELDGGATLLGDVSENSVSPNPLAAKSVRLRLIEDGMPPEPRDGRAGDFRWPPVTQPSPTASAPIGPRASGDVAAPLNPAG